MPEFMTNLMDDSGGWVSVVIDFIIVYYLIYISLLLVRGTRTVPMALGLLLLIVVYLVSKAVGLVTTFMLLDQFMSVVVIFTLIIFQDDIRRALVRVGKLAWFSKAKETAVLEEVIRAASSMAEKNIGALIVFEREASLNEFIIEQGTKIEAAVTKELLYSIFIPRMENPLHDGAAIIKNYQIREAGAFLPLSSNPKIEKTLGTRHRAAIGITEETDAVAVVVSEERGAVSLCYGGKLNKDLDVSMLRKALMGLFLAEKKPLGQRGKKTGQKKYRAPDRSQTGDGSERR